MDLTSRDGDWFLDELCSMSGNVNHLLLALNDPALTHLLSADMCQRIAAAMKATDAVYTSLQVRRVVQLVEYCTRRYAFTLLYCAVDWRAGDD